MKKDTINLADTVKIFKKNLKGFYLSITIGLIIGLIGVFINTNYLEKKIILSAKISIKNPLDNYLVLDLFSLDTIQVDDKKVSVTPTQDKIKNYYVMTKEYMELVLNTLDLKRYDIFTDEYGYSINSEKKQTEFTIIIKDANNIVEIEKNLKKMVNDFNKLIKPIILKNILTETAFIENFLEISKENKNSQRLKILIKIRKNTLNSFEDQNFEIFDLTSSKQIKKTSNTKITLVSILIAFSIFLMFIILRK